MQNTSISSTDSMVIHMMRFPLVCLVVIIHAFSLLKGWDPNNLHFFHLSGADLYSYFGIAFSMTLAHIAVPTFFIISGFLFFYGLKSWDWKIYLTKLKKRVNTLLIPYLVWNTILILKTLVSTRRIVDWWIEHNGIYMYYHADEMVERINWLGSAGKFSFPILVPMWYIRDLIILCLLSPIVYLMFYKERGITSFIFLGLIVAVYITAIYPYIPGISPGPVLFFCVGAFLSLNNYSLTKVCRSVRVPSYIIFFALWIPLILFAGYKTATGNYIYPFFVMAGVVSFISLFVEAYLVNIRNKSVSAKKFIGFCRKYESDVFFIFAAHTFLLPYVDKILRKGCAFLSNTHLLMLTDEFANSHPFLLIICYILKIFITIILCIIISNLIKPLTKVRCLLTGK